MSEIPDNKLQSGPGPGGRRSNRTYSRAEVAAARRLGLAGGREKYDQLGGPIFWASGPWYLDDIRQTARDATLLLEAMEREWDKEGRGMSEDRCPECRGHGALTPYDLDPCPACGGTCRKSTPEKLRGPAGDASVMASYDDVVSGPTPENKSGITADLIDRAVEVALAEVPLLRDVMRFPDAVMTKIMLAVFPLLTEQGRQQERERWEARIEAEAERLKPWSMPARALRSLLTEEGEHGE